MSNAEKPRFHGRLPGYAGQYGRETSSEREYIEAWRQFMEPLEALGCRIHSFDPGVAFSIHGHELHRVDEETLHLIGRLFRGETFDAIKQDVEGARAHREAERIERERLERLREEDFEAWCKEKGLTLLPTGAARGKARRAGKDARRDGDGSGAVLRARPRRR